MMHMPSWPPEPPLIAVIRIADAGSFSDEHLHALGRHGLTVEVAMTCSGATELLRRAAGILGSTVMVGAGTVLSPEDADAAEEAGAQFASSPTLWPGLEERAVPALPGVLTPGEVAHARAKGFNRLKLFPARLGPAYLRDMKTVFPDVAFWPSGGVSAENTHEWRQAGAAGLFLGRNLVGGPTEPSDPEMLDARAADFAAAWHASD